MGDPVEHSLSPVLHQAAYSALGLTGWDYGRERVPRGDLRSFVATLDERWAGLSVTAPGKEEALALAATAGREATLTGAANTLIRTGQGWHAENTDVAGLRAALLEVGVTAQECRTATLLGSGATARSALVALQGLGVREVTCVVRREVREDTQRLAAVLDIALVVVPAQEWAARADAPPRLVVSTLPGGVDLGNWSVPSLADAVVFDVVYAPWPTPLATAATMSGSPSVHGGALMLLHQAGLQVQLMTGRAAPLAPMRVALADHLPAGF